MTRVPLYISRLVPNAVVIAVGLLAGSALAAVPYSEDWSAGNTNGWIGNTTSSVVVREAGIGNPAGSIATRRDLTPPVFEIGATTELAAVSGDYTGQPAWMVSFDVFYDIGNFTDAWLRFRYQDFTMNGWYLDVADVFPNSWQSYSAMFDPSWTDAQAAANGWVDETGGTVSWQQLMSDVYHPEIRLSLGDDFSAIALIDNFVLKSVVPEPATTALLLTAIGGVVLVMRRVRRD